MDSTNKPRLYIFVKAPIIIVAILIFISDLNQLVDYYHSTGNEHGFIEYLKIAFNTSILRTSFIMLIPLIGIFLNKKIGWILILSFYYFWVILFIYATFSTKIERNGTIVFISGIFLFSLFFIGLMNSRENYTLVYGIDKSEKLKMNFVALLVALIGISLVVVLNLN